MDVVDETFGAQRSIPSIYDDDDEVVGFEEDAENIMKKLTRGVKDLDVVSIFGMPGLGKTTLARKVYNNPCIVHHFDVKVWCAVSQAYNRRSLLVEIFKQATNDKSEIKEDDDIADKLQKALKGRRYLIVLDDIWDVEAWEDLCLCFPKGEYGSRVIVTTRIEQVATHLQQPYSLRFLTPEESWELLEKKVFQGEKCPPDLLEAGLQVAHHCKGLPLVIVLIAGIIMKMERHPAMWMEIASDLSCYVLGEQSMKVMQSSYDHLEDHLKTCLLYMALFPEDWKIEMSNLMMWWMAEEFILNVDKENMEEASRTCLNDLLNRSLVMVSCRDFNGDITSCSLHDVVREFCLRKLTEEKFMQLTVPYNPYQHSYTMESRLSIYIHDDLVKQLDHYEYQVDKIPMLLESKCFGECPIASLEFIAHPKFNTWNRSNPLPLLNKLRLVRVLQFTEAYLPSSWPSVVRSLTLLRYLEICVTEFDIKWISHQLDLQTLIVKSPPTMSTSLEAIWKMRKLRFLQLHTLSFVWEDAIFEETSTTMLENMKIFRSRIYVDDTTSRFWWRFPIIEEISFAVRDSPCYPLFPRVEVHTRLQSLKLEANNNKFWDSVGWERYFVLPSNIRRLCLRGCLLTEGMVSNIARLRKLESLEIYGGFPGSKYYWDVTNVEFPSLKYLTLECMMMNQWKASDESFPVLEKLNLIFCFYFMEIPPSFADIPKLQHIKLDKCSPSIVNSAMNIKREIEENTGCDTLQLHIS